MSFINVGSVQQYRLNQSKGTVKVRQEKYTNQKRMTCHDVGHDVTSWCANGHREYQPILLHASNKSSYFERSISFLNIVCAGTLGWMPWTYRTYPNLFSSPPYDCYLNCKKSGSLDRFCWRFGLIFVFFKIPGKYVAFSFFSGFN